MQFSTYLYTIRPFGSRTYELGGPSQQTSATRINGAMPLLKMHFLGSLPVGPPGVLVSGWFSFSGFFWPWRGSSPCAGSRFGKVRSGIVSSFVGDPEFGQEESRFLRDGFVEKSLRHEDSLISKRSEFEVGSRISDSHKETESSRFAESTEFETNPESSNARF